MSYKSITGYEGLYLVDDFGRVKSLITNKVLKGTVNTMGYIVVGLYKDKKCRICTVHRLVAFEFHSLSYFIGAHVNHKDGDKLNNHFSNLEWVTHAENIRHSFRVLNRVTNNPINSSSSKPVAQLVGLSKTCYGFKWVQL